MLARKQTTDCHKNIYMLSPYEEHNLGYVFKCTIVIPQKISIYHQKDLKTLNYFQKFLRDISWICSSLGISNSELSNFLPNLSLKWDSP